MSFGRHDSIEFRVKEPQHVLVAHEASYWGKEIVKPAS